MNRFLREPSVRISLAYRIPVIWWNTRCYRIPDGREGHPYIANRNTRVSLEYDGIPDGREGHPYISCRIKWFIQWDNDVFASCISSITRSMNVPAVVVIQHPLRVQTPPRLGRSGLSADDPPQQANRPTLPYDRA
jgi:hypothetical protein